MKKHSLIKALLIIVIMICFSLLPGLQCESTGRSVMTEEGAAAPSQYFCGFIFDVFSETDPCTVEKCSTDDYCGGTPYNGDAVCVRPDEIVGSEGVPYNGEPDLTDDNGADHDQDEQRDGGGRDFMTATAVAAVFRRPYAHVEGLVQESRQHIGDSSGGDGDNKNLLKPDQPYEHKLCCCVDDYDQSDYLSDDDNDDDDDDMFYYRYP